MKLFIFSKLLSKDTVQFVYAERSIEGVDCLGMIGYDKTTGNFFKHVSIYHG